MKNKMMEILNCLASNEGAMIPRPASEEDIKRRCDDFIIVEIDIRLPGDYIDFLKMHNGFAWNGIELFGTDQVTDPETNYTLNDIVSFNDDIYDYWEDCSTKHRVFIGRADDDIYAYNFENKKYEILDINGRDVMEEYESFAEFFINTAGLRM
ncbi:MAG: SMI1/KNR4 family protein [Prevotellaceae bacterium]|jgi:hypothetical protein|nr:SMI1/KNR4 family protein [Prevotellaceae bacterium]